MTKNNSKGIRLVIELLTDEEGIKQADAEKLVKEALQDWIDNTPKYSHFVLHSVTGYTRAKKKIMRAVWRAMGKKSQHHSHWNPDDPRRSYVNEENA